MNPGKRFWTWWRQEALERREEERKKRQHVCEGCRRKLPRVIKRTRSSLALSLTNPTYYMNTIQTDQQIPLIIRTPFRQTNDCNTEKTKKRAALRWRRKWLVVSLTWSCHWSFERMVCAHVWGQASSQQSQLVAVCEPRSVWRAQKVLQRCTLSTEVLKRKIWCGSPGWGSVQWQLYGWLGQERTTVFGRHWSSALAWKAHLLLRFPFFNPGKAVGGEAIQVIVCKQLLLGFWELILASVLPLLQSPRHEWRGHSQGNIQQWPDGEFEVEITTRVVGFWYRQSCWGVCIVVQFRIEKRKHPVFFNCKTHTELNSRMFWSSGRIAQSLIVVENEIGNWRFHDTSTWRILFSELCSPPSRGHYKWTRISHQNWRGPRPARQPLCVWSLQVCNVQWGLGVRSHDFRKKNGGGEKLCEAFDPYCKEGCPSGLGLRHTEISETTSWKSKPGREEGT